MSRSTSSRLIAALLLATALLLPGTASAEPWNDSRSWMPGDLLARLGSLIMGIWNKEGCILDPHGACVAAPSAPQTKEGCGIDPHGGCVNGQSASAPSQKIGCGIDPHGRCGT